MVEKIDFFTNEKCFQSNTTSDSFVFKAIMLDLHVAIIRSSIL